MSMQRRLAHAATFILAAFIVLSGCGSDKKEGAPEPAAEAEPQGNLQSTIQSINTGTTTPVVTFTLFDEKGAALDPTTTGVSARFTIARIKPEPDGNYESYIESSTAGQPGYDSGGTFAPSGNGTYTYTFATNIKDSAQTLGGIALDDTTAGLTHTVAAQIQRTTTSIVGTSFQQAVNPYLNFRPDGGSVTATREVVSISACNACHGKLAVHGGGRRDIALCILCHNPGPTDPQTDQPIDMKSLVHKIHMGENLPSNEAGGDYTIIGFENSVHSYKTVAYPFMSRDSFIANTPIECVKCHIAGKDLMGRNFGRDADKWKENPAREKCTTCHDLTTFDGNTTISVMSGTTPITVTAVPHAGGPLSDDLDCAGCHADTGSNDYSDVTSSAAPVPSAHLILEKSDIFTGINFQILSVASAVSGTSPSVRFRITDNAGNALDPAALGSSYTLKFGYFNQADYLGDNMQFTNNTTAQPISQSLTGATSNGDGTYSVIFSSPIPTTATGTGVIGLEGRATYTFSTPHKGAQSRTVGGKNVQYYVDLATGAQVTDPSKQRRRVVDIDKCNVCHWRLSLHGANRTNSIEQCVICHNPNAVWTTTTPEPSPIDFKYFIHFIHTGEGLDVHQTAYYDGGFAEVRYPRDRRDCLACHMEADPKTYGLPLPANVLGTTISAGTNTFSDSDNTRILPMKAVCTSCHDTELAIEHADSRTVSETTETCNQCHATGLTLGPDFAHTPER